MGKWGGLFQGRTSLEWQHSFFGSEQYWDRQYEPLSLLAPNIIQDMSLKGILSSWWKMVEESITIPSHCFKAGNEWDIVFFAQFSFFLWQRLYRENYEKTKAKSMNYCETPKYQLDTLLKNFSEVRRATPTSWAGRLFLPIEKSLLTRSIVFSLTRQNIKIHT